MQVEEKFLTGECGKGGRCMIEVGLNPIQSEAKAYFFFFFFFFIAHNWNSERECGKPLKLKMNCITLSFKKV